jgi:hypothetical protein
MMKRREQGAEPFQFTWNVGRVNRLSMDINTIGGRGFDVLECRKVWEFVCQPNAIAHISLKLSRKV